MEGKSIVKLSHVVAFLLLASLFKPLTARDLVLKGSDEEIEVLRLPPENENPSLDDSQPSCKGKHSWPELVGKPAFTAKKIIEKENSAALVVVLLPGMPATGDFVCGRVRLLVSWNLIVQRTPTMEVCCFVQITDPSMV
ncbi:proteinase inhibitor I-B-like isoform X2 [Lycium ferocissimum]|uniref:proteinase inhibitor I-B-like isoform X2 n=1 Tax=Lycium ferocissimum TaxID=112874 RepID=UPI00281672C2|nr:proteinase inhibitor I-B-like isoform X2 [Lycium ferocissimum]